MLEVGRLVDPRRLVEQVLDVEGPAICADVGAATTGIRRPVKRHGLVLGDVDGDLSFRTSTVSTGGVVELETGTEEREDRAHVGGIAGDLAGGIVSAIETNPAHGRCEGGVGGGGEDSRRMVAAAAHERDARTVD